MEKPNSVQINKPNYTQSPFLILWELTKACSLACRHCRAKAQCNPHKDQLSTNEALQLVEEFKQFGRPLIVLTGGDPAQRNDLDIIIKHLKLNEFKVAITPSGTPKTNRTMIEKLKESGIDRLAISLDGADSLRHDSFRRVKGSFDWSMNIVSWAREFAIPLQINTTMSRYNLDQFEQMSTLVSELKAVLWSVFFLVPTGRANDDMQISAFEAESILRKMSTLSEYSSFDVKATACPQFRRILIEEGSAMETFNSTIDVNADRKLGQLRSYQSVNDGRGLLFISDVGEIYPSGFLPISCGNVREVSLSSVYREHEIFKQLRNPELLEGKCGRCDYKYICGGSRARAYARYGNYLAQDDLCLYSQP